MAAPLDNARGWMRDGDRLLARAGQLVQRFDADHEPRHLEMAAHDFSRAAQMYLTGAVEYQHGRESVTIATAKVDDTARLVQHLDGRLRQEAEAALQSARAHLLPNQDTGPSSGVESARTFAESLRERLAHAAPELFDRSGSREAPRDTSTSRSR